VLTLACGSVPRSNYYTVDYTPASPAGSVPVAAASQVGVALPQANHLLRQDRIVYFTNQNELNFYHYHRWAESPTFMVRSLLMRQLRSGGLFDDIVPYRAQKGLDYVLRGRLLAMEEVDTPTEVSARFGLELELVQQQDAHVVWSDRHTCTRPVGTKTVEAVVATMSECVQETLDRLSHSMGEAVSRLERAAAAEKESQ
jgi:ABC-type uncharacterized transport system auxiliary subunit